MSKVYQEFSKNGNIEIEHSQPRLHIETGAVEGAIQTLETLIIANLEDKIGFTESENLALRVMQFTIHTGLEVSSFELHHGKKPRTELTNILKSNRSYLSDWKTMNVSVPPNQNPIYVAPTEKGELTDQIIMARKRKIPCCPSHTSPNRKPVKNG